MRGILTFILWIDAFIFLFVSVLYMVIKAQTLLVLIPIFGTFFLIATVLEKLTVLIDTYYG